jgi:hypothetical protein
MNIAFDLMQFVVPIAIYFAIGLRFAYKFFQDNIDSRSTFGDVFDVSIGAICIAFLWFIVLVGKLIKES